MPQLIIRPDYEPGKFVKQPAVGINLEKLEISNGVATAEVEADSIFYVTTHFVVNEKDTMMTIQLSAPDGHRVRFRDFPDDMSGRMSWTVGVAYRDYFKYRRVFLEVQP